MIILFVCAVHVRCFWKNSHSFYYRTDYSTFNNFTNMKSTCTCTKVLLIVLVLEYIEKTYLRENDLYSLF